MLEFHSDIPSYSIHQHALALVVGYTIFGIIMHKLVIILKHTTCCSDTENWLHNWHI